MTLYAHASGAPAQPWSLRMVDSVIRRGEPFRWHYECGLMLRAMEQVWLRTNDRKYDDCIRRELEPFIGPEWRGTDRFVRRPRVWAQAEMARGVRAAAPGQKVHLYQGAANGS